MSSKKGKGHYTKVSASKSNKRKKKSSTTQTTKKYPAHISALAKVLGITPSRIKYAGHQYYGLDVYIDTKTGNSWAIAYDSDQVDEAIKESFRDSFDDLGLEAIEEKYLAHYIDEDALWEIYIDGERDYVDSLSGSELYEEFGVHNSHDAIERIEENLRDAGGVVHYIIDNMGLESLKDIMEQYGSISDLIDFDALARDEQMNTSAGNILNRIDGDEIELKTPKGWMHVFQVDKGDSPITKTTGDLIFKGSLEAKKAFKKYGKNFMTPDIIGYGTLSRDKKLYYEYSQDDSLYRKTNLYGVTVIRLVGDKPEGLHDKSKSFDSAAQAQKYIENLHKEFGDES